MPLQLYYYKLIVLRDCDWHGCQGYIFATTENQARAFLMHRYLNGVIRKPYGEDIPSGEEVRILLVERIPVEEGTCL